MKNREITGTWLRINHVFGSEPGRITIVGILRLLNKQEITLRGTCDPEDLISGITFRFFGHMKNHPKYGDQFIFTSFVQETPVDEDSIIAYLETCRNPARGSITRRVAMALFELYGTDAIDKVINEPHVCSQKVKQWDIEKATNASQYLGSQVATQKSKLDLITLLNGRSFPKKTADRCIQEWGVAAAQTVREDPYVLMELPGIGFLGADKLYCDLARQTCKTDAELQEKLAHIKRQALCAVHHVSLNTSRTGSTWTPIGAARASIHQSINRTLVRDVEAIKWAVNEGLLMESGDLVALYRKACNEITIANYFAMMTKENNWPSVEDIEPFAPIMSPLSQHQLDGIFAATRKVSGCLQGSPGVGKTFAVACIAKALIAKYGIGSVAMAAPTGKAAVRMTQSLAGNGVPVVATTIHRLLQVSSESRGGWGFFYNATNPLPFRFLIIDECSMIDTDLMASLISACTATTHILLVGDANQLAPVGHGKPFLDLQTCIPTGHLTEIRRNSGQIVRSCAEIRDKGTITFSTIRSPENNLLMIPCEDVMPAIQSALSQVAAEGDDIINEAQVMTAKNVHRRELNRKLQQFLNPNGEQIKGNPFRIDDKVVCLTNGRYPSASDHDEEIFVANGELGYVVDLQPGRMKVMLFDPDRTIMVFHTAVSGDETKDDSDTDKGAVGDWDLGYCLSVHRSQGSQWKHVIVTIEKGAEMIHSKNWLFTAISRAEKYTILIGDRRLVGQMLKKNGLQSRVTRLEDRYRTLWMRMNVNFDDIFASV